MLYIKFDASFTGIIFSSKFNKRIAMEAGDYSAQFTENVLWEICKKYQEEPWLHIDADQNLTAVAKGAPEQFFNEMYERICKFVHGNRAISNGYWWFGINNESRGKKSGHVFHSDMEEFLSGGQRDFFWPCGGSSYSKQFYSRIQEGDKIILWMGHGRFAEWGIIGFASVSAVCEAGSGAGCCLSNLHRLEPYFTPYPKNKPQETEQTLFLREVFGDDFKALNDVFRQVNYIAKKATPVTIDTVSSAQYEKTFNRGAKKRPEGGAAEEDGLLPEERLERETYFEGIKKHAACSVYERNRQAREKCLAHYGTTCQICGFNFEKQYGLAGKGIHVHHRKPLAEIKENYEVDPVRDLLPVCPNCHAAIHSSSPARTVDDIRALLAQAKMSGNG